jgi:hypothetical protein
MKSLQEHLACLDAPRLQLGPLDRGIRKLSGHPDLGQDVPMLYSWVMNNMWEANFEPNLGGFHEFNFGISWGRELKEFGGAARECPSLRKTQGVSSGGRKR